MHAAEGANEAPTLLSTALLRYDAFALSALPPNSPVDSWPSTGTSTNAMVATACVSSPSHRPAFETDPDTGLPHVRMTRDNNVGGSGCSYLSAAGQQTFPAAAAGQAPGLTLFMVVRMPTVFNATEAVSGEVFLDFRSGSLNDRLRLTRSASGLLFVYRTVGVDVLTRALPFALANGRFEVFMLRVAGANFTYRHNNVIGAIPGAASSSYSAAAVTYQKVHLNMDASSVDALGAYTIRELLIWPSPLSDADAGLVYELLSAKWQVPRVLGERARGLARRGGGPVLRIILTSSPQGASGPGTCKQRCMACIDICMPHAAAMAADAHGMRDCWPHHPCLCTGLALASV